MRTLIFFFASALALSFCYSQAYGQSSQSKLDITHLTGDCYIFTTYKNLNGYMFPSNGMYVVTTDGIVLIDTPWDTTQCQPLIDSLARRHRLPVVLCIATHFHDDRTAGLAFLRGLGVKTFSSALTYRLCAERNEKQSEWKFDHDTTFVVGQYKFETFYGGEGHSRDNIVVWMGKQKILYGGCLVKSTENRGLGNIADANLSAWGPTIKKVMKKYQRPKFVIPGHFGWDDRQSLKHTLMLLRDAK